ncbi:hypothetical protein KCU81_g4426, partial [Aureobasidium melanogenum]|uniref:Uncharacterized protein n=1 Tax=Aureobasidium melanogenum (strain CBS 110374) TaxID=1043003 RepID=A0A074W8R3_AURM1
MHFTDEQLENDPELRPKVWRSESAFQQERLILLNNLADILHSQTDSPPSIPDELSLASPTSTIIVVDPGKTPRPTSSIFSSSIASSVTSPTRSVSSIFSLPFGSSSRLSVASPGPASHTPIVFSSPQTSTFSFETANSSPAKVDSVMGSPVKFRSPSIFKRKNKNAAKKAPDDNDSVASSITSIKEGSIFDYFKATSIKKKARKSRSNKSDASNDGKSIEPCESDDEHTVKEFDRSDSSSSMDSKGKEYVVERLGFGGVGEPQPVEHQYCFVKAQIEKVKGMFLGREGAKTKL